MIIFTHRKKALNRKINHSFNYPLCLPMRVSALILVFCGISIKLFTQPEVTKVPDTLPEFGEQSISTDFFRQRYLHNDIVNYLDNLNDFVTWQSETTGSFNMPDQMIFSVSGNSHKWNKFYIDGFRLENRFSPGSPVYTPDLYTQSVKVNYNHSNIQFSTNTSTPNSLALRYNIGGLGGISPYTKELINLFHSTASERLYKPIEYRRKMKGAGSLFLNYSLPANNKDYFQQIYADIGTRMLTGFDETGISKYYPENFGKIQLSGQLPGIAEAFFDRTNYLITLSTRENLYTELNFSQTESAKSNAASASVWSNGKTLKTLYTTGFTFSTDKIKHNSPGFARNVIDQDGEAFEPWYPAGVTGSVSHAVSINHKINNFININFDGYNSLIKFSPETENFTNQLYVQHPLMPYTSLYLYEWESKGFTSGILENTLSIKALKKTTAKTSFNAGLDFTLDGMILSEKTVLRPNFQAHAAMSYKPARWFAMEINLARNRVSYNYDDIRYTSNHYLNGNLYYWNDINKNRQFENNEKSDFFSTTGGKYRNFAPGLSQPVYYTLDIPLHFTFGNHQISFYNTYKKYINFGLTLFDNNAEEYGFYQNHNDKQIFFLNNGTVNYIIDAYPADYMHTESAYNFATNAPFYFSSIIKYAYTTEKLLFSFSWTSQIMTGISTLGNGPLHNNIGVYSETTANPNNQYKLIGRLDQDRAYVARMLFSYKVSNRLSFAVSGKFKDGQPFTSFRTKVYTDENGNSQISVWNLRTKGINPFDGDFGSRKDAFFNFEVRARYQFEINKKLFEIEAMMYNLYDFGTELHEYTFDPDNTNHRYALELNIPRGLMITGKMYF